MRPVVLRHSYTRSRDVAQASVRYYQMRPRGREEPPRSLFTRDRTITRAEATRLLDEHQPSSGRYLAHRLMLSPPPDGRPEDLQELTRHTLRELEKARGVELHWVAVEHHNTEYPHVHIVVAGGAEGPGGGRRELRLERRDHARIKEDARDFCEIHARVRDDWDRALDPGDRDDDDWTP